MGALALLASLLEPKPVTVEAGLCLNRRHKDAACDRCVAACPAGAVTLSEDGPAVNADACNRCGICQAACPVRAFHVPEADPVPLMTKVHGKTVVSLSCSRAAAPDAVHVSCLAALGAEDLAVLAAAGATPLGARELHLNDSPCASCSHGAHAAIRRRARQAAAILHALGEPARITMGSDSSQPAPPAPGPEARGEAVSRRDLFRLWRRQGVAAVAETAPHLAWLDEPTPPGLPQHLPLSRQRLLKLLASRKPVGGGSSGATNAAVGPSLVPFAGRRAGPSCDGCGLCASLCPTKALRLTELPVEGSPAAGSGLLRLTFQPSACLDCGLCDQACPAQALARYNLDDLTPLVRRDRDVLWQAEKQVCRRCSQSYTADGELCPACKKSQSLLADVLHQAGRCSGRT